MEEQNGSGAALCTDKLNLWAQTEVSSLKWKNCHKASFFHPSCKKTPQDLQQVKGMVVPASLPACFYPHAGEYAPFQGQAPITARTSSAAITQWASPSAGSALTSHAQQLTDTPFHTSLHLTSISKTEIKIFTTKMKFLTQKLGKLGFHSKEELWVIMILVIILLTLEIWENWSFKTCNKLIINSKPFLRQENKNGKSLSHLLRLFNTCKNKVNQSGVTTKIS